MFVALALSSRHVTHETPVAFTSHDEQSVRGLHEHVALLTTLSPLVHRYGARHLPFSKTLPSLHDRHPDVIPVVTFLAHLVHEATHEHESSKRRSHTLFATHAKSPLNPFTWNLHTKRRIENRGRIRNASHRSHRSHRWVHVTLLYYLFSIIHCATL